MFRRVALIGTGLIGGSLALALRERGEVGEVVGYARRLETRLAAERRGLIDRPADSIAEAVEGADLVFLATPVKAMDAVLGELAGVLPDDALITDGGSVKGAVVERARAQLSAEQLARFVPGHPIAGRERSGPEAATAELYRGHRVILTPIEENRAEDVARIEAMWQATGARVERLDVAHHDHVLAATSHLPHAAAFAMVSSLARLAERYEVFRYAAGGFRDFTRIASSDPVMWRDICLDNRDEILQMLDHYRAELDGLHDMLASADGEAIERYFAEAKAVRDALYPVVEAGDGEQDDG
ncbi:prephenate dehydrogenase/arogenate dehydrogenase family protein [Guyparkeria hydrothermalis]|uniref:prephenate dehydrogenase n=1 Tax=Guyparkeria hydrothermalis TaxID=923 RepID=UPI002021F6D7|nr:prephenate dehydrogenase/arogenate dehydrogenase family protein [Guyparkeria hydrothermalis]MCL7744341.1 prephenate dehydrogenase/arogenate dehydrogenase family protein [Guyparkeria hydrothermalis]